MTASPTIVLGMIVFVAFMISLSKGGLGGMLGALGTPMLVLVMPANEVLGLLLPILLLADAFALVMHWKKWNGRLVWLLIPGAVVGVTVGTYFIANAPTNALKLGLAVITLVFVFYKLIEKRLLASLKYEDRPWHGWLAGTVGGFASSLAHSGGPPISMYLLMQDLTPGVFNATSVLFFAILNWIKVPYYLYIHLIDFRQLWQIAWIAPIIPIGVWFGHWIGDRISKEVFDGIMVALLLLTALLLIFA